MQGSKMLVGIILVTILLIGAGVVLLGGKEASSSQVTSEVLGIEASPSFYDLGSVPINGGVISKEYVIKNASVRPIKLKKITTSCMCTTASVQIGGEETKFFGMEGHGDANPPVNIEIGVGEEGKVVVKFDPAAHGPQGVGPFNRVVWLTFSDPGGIKELSFSGTVTPQ
jgi:hypothetical protein